MKLRQLYTSSGRQFSTLVRPVHGFTALHHGEKVTSSAMCGQPAVSGVLIGALVLLLLLPCFIISTLRDSLGANITTFVGKLINCPRFEGSVHFLVGTMAVPIISAIATILLFICLP